MLIEFDLVRRLTKKMCFKRLITAVLVMAFGAFIAGCGESKKLLPEESAESVVGKFYEYITQAKLRGGNLLIREAYKLTSSKDSQQGQAKFIEIINNYPSGFLVDVINSTVDPKKGRAEVIIEYKMASMFGDAVAVRTVIPLNVDEENGVWKIDFTGETDGLDLARLRAEESAKDPIKTVAGRAIK